MRVIENHGLSPVSRTIALLGVFAISMGLYSICLCAEKKAQGGTKDKSASVLNYYQVRFPKELKDQYSRYRQQPSNDAVEGEYVSENACVVSAVSGAYMKNHWIRIYAPHKDVEQWIPVKYLVLSNECEVAYQLAEDMFSNLVKEFGKVPYKKKYDQDNEFKIVFKILKPWLKMHVAKFIMVHSTYNPKTDDLCDFCYSERISGTTVVNGSYVGISENPGIARFIQVFYDARDMKKDFRTIKQAYFSLLDIAVIKHKVVFFYCPGCAHNAEWRLSNKNGKWLIDEIYAYTD